MKQPTKSTIERLVRTSLSSWAQQMKLFYTFIIEIRPIIYDNYNTCYKSLEYTMKYCTSYLKIFVRIIFRTVLYISELFTIAESFQDIIKPPEVSRWFHFSIFPYFSYGHGWHVTAYRNTSTLQAKVWFVTFYF